MSESLPRFAVHVTRGGAWEFIREHGLLTTEDVATGGMDSGGAIDVDTFVTTRRDEPVVVTSRLSGTAPMRGRVDASSDGTSISIAITRETLPQLREGFRWSLTTSYVAPEGGVAQDGCPSPGGDEDVDLNSAPFPADTVSQDAADAPDPVQTTSTSSTEAPTATSATSLPEQLSESQAAELLLDAWNDGDREAAHQLASPEAVAQLFETDSPGDAALQTCRHWAEVTPGEYPVDATFYCDGSFDGGTSTVTLYVDGGASAGYSVSQVGLFGNPPGFTPAD